MVPGDRAQGDPPDDEDDKKKVPKIHDSTLTWAQQVKKTLKLVAFGDAEFLCSPI
jgi:hypothetical protein